jgi:hypothetical protein
VGHAACCALFLLSCAHDHVSFKHCYVSSGILQEQDATMTASSMLSAPHIYHSALCWVRFQQQQQHLSGRHVAMVDCWFDCWFDSHTAGRLAVAPQENALQ